MMQNTVTKEEIQELVDTAAIKVFTVFDKATVVVCKLKNGFCMTESSACVSPENYSAEMGKSICLEKITNKLWELEGYALQKQIYNKQKENTGASEPSEPITPFQKAKKEIQENKEAFSDNKSCYIPLTGLPYIDPREVNGSDTAITYDGNIDLLEIVRDRLQGFQKGDYATRENAIALTHIEEALLMMNKRVEDRAERGVLGTVKK